MSRLRLGVGSHGLQDHDFLITRECATHLALPGLASVGFDDFELRSGAGFGEDFGEVPAEGMADFRVNDDVSAFPHQLASGVERISESLHDAGRLDTPVDAENSYTRKVHEHQRGSPQ